MLNRSSACRDEPTRGSKQSAGRAARLNRLLHRWRHNRWCHRWLHRCLSGLVGLLPSCGGGVIVLGLWWGSVVHFAVPPYLLPAPDAVFYAFIADFHGFLRATALTFGLAVSAFALAAAGGLAAALLFTLMPVLHRLLFPYVIALQVTPIIALAPLVLIWVGYDRARLAVILLAALTAFFPVLVNAYDGLRRPDPGLHDLFRLYRASPADILLRLRLPSALPMILSGLRIAANLALIGAVVAEFIAGSGASQGLAWRILESGRRLQTDTMLAALLVLAMLGIAINALAVAAERRFSRRFGQAS